MSSPSASKRKGIGKEGLGIGIARPSIFHFTNAGGQKKKRGEGFFPHLKCFFPFLCGGEKRGFKKARIKHGRLTLREGSHTPQMPKSGGKKRGERGFFGGGGGGKGDQDNAQASAITPGGGGGEKGGGGEGFGPLPERSRPSEPKGKKKKKKEKKEWHKIRRLKSYMFMQGSLGWGGGKQKEEKGKRSGFRFTPRTFPSGK